MNADTQRFSRVVSAFIFVYLWFLLASCSPASPPTAFRPPTRLLPTQPLPSITPVPPVFSLTSLSAVSPTPILPCTNQLTFVQDLTIPDGTVLAPGAPIDKQWLVANSGSCNWDSRYRLKPIGGEVLGAPTEQALYPAKAGTQATLRISFTTPLEAGIHQTAWQAFGPDGIAFGDPVFMQIVVQP